MASPTMSLLNKKKVAQAKDVSPEDVEKIGGGVQSVGTVEVETELTATKAKSKAKAKEVKKVDLIVDVAQAYMNMSEAQVMKELRDLLESEGENDFRLGGILSVIQVNGIWEGVSATFRIYVENEIGIPYRKAMYLIGIYNGLVESGVSWDKVQNVGWTKLKDIAPLLTMENVDEWVKRAKEMTHVQLREYIKGLNGEGVAEEGKEEESVATLTTFTVKLHEDQKELVKKGLEQARSEYGTEYDSVALEHIVTSYMEGGTGKAKVGKGDLVDLLKKEGSETSFDLFTKAFPDLTLSVDVEME